MAKRPVFLISEKPPYFREETVEFVFFSGFADSQKKKSVRSLHDAFLTRHPAERVMEISGASESELGAALSAFHLRINTLDGKSYSVESAFQGSKIFERGGPYKDLLEKTSREAKKDPRLKNSGRLTGFRFSGKTFPLTPTTYFYNWLYINALCRHPELAEPLAEYTAFTDIAFNPERSINCQACAAAVYVSLQRTSRLDNALKSHIDFLHVVYGDAQTSPACGQLSLWDRL